MKNRIAELRKKKKVSQASVAEALGITRQAISLYERGEHEPKLETWQKLAKFFDAPVPYLQGFGLSNEQAINLVWKWAHNEADYSNYQMFDILKTFFKSNFSNEELKKIFEDEQSFAQFMNNRFKSVFNYYSLSTMLSPEDLEKALTIVVGEPLDSIQAQIDGIDFKNDSNDRIHEILGQIFTDVFMYIDKRK